MSVLKIKDNKGNFIPIHAIKGERGPSGVYIGSGEMPEDCNVKIDPDGIVQLYNPDIKTENMTIPVGVDENGKLWANKAIEPSIEYVDKSYVDDLFNSIVNGNEVAY